jgi:hypothetical protein
MELNAILCVWNEEDIIESTIRHAFAQGCANVFIIDNGSTDTTVEIATNAGAILVASFESRYFDEIQKISHLNTAVRRYNAQSPEEHVWWLYVDADEFPNIDYNISLLGFLRALDPSIRAVHGHLFEHFPTHPPWHVSGRHPADYMPLACKSQTAKIPLLRYDKGAPHLYSGAGAHTFDSCGEALPIAEDILHIHHFPYRRPENSIRRLQQLLARNADGTSRVDKLDGYAKLRAHSPDAQSEYHDRFQRAQALYGQNKYAALMADELPYVYGNIARWYDASEAQGGDDGPLSQGIRHFFLEDYDAALCRFYDAAQSAHDHAMQHLLYVKMASCLSWTHKEEALRLLRPLPACEDAEIRAYAARQAERIRDDKAPARHRPRKRDGLTWHVRHYCGKFEKHFFLCTDSPEETFRQRAVPPVRVVPPVPKNIVHIAGAAIAPLEGSMDSFTGGVYADGKFLEDSLLERGQPAPLPEIRECLPGSYIFGGCLFSHFGHYIWESLARLYAIRQCDTHPILFLSPNDRIFTMQKMFFKTLGIKNEIHLVKVPTSVKNLIYSLPGSAIDPLFITDEQLNALSCLNFSKERNGEKIWLSRSRVNSGKIVNEEYIEAELEKIGYRIIHPETLPLREQVRLLSTSGIVAGFDGSQFFSCLFARKIRGKFFVFNRRKRIADTITHALERRNVEMYTNTFPVDYVSGNRASACFFLPEPDKVIDLLRQAA